MQENWKPPTNSMAAGSLIAGIAAWVACPVLGAAVAVFLGHMARDQIRHARQGGWGLAVAGQILGYVQLAVAAVFGFVWVAAEIYVLTR